MNLLILKHGVKIYYDKKSKIISRHPTKSNRRKSGSDNSLYMGLITSLKSVELICNIMDLSSINEFKGRKLEMTFYGEPIEIQCNINKEGHLQYKIVGNGMMNKLVEKYENNIGKIDEDSFLISLDFINNEISFKEIIDLSSSEEEFKQIIKESKKYKNKDVDIDGYIEAKLTVRNNRIQRIFREDLLVEFETKCALCGTNMKEMLHASHILPYSKCKTTQEMMDHNNGLLLCANHDELFDKRFISFNKNTGLIVISKKINKNLYDFLNINPSMKLDKKYLTKKRMEFLSTHTVK